MDQVEALLEALQLTNPVIHDERHRALFEVYLSLRRYEAALIKIAGGALPPDEIASQALRKNDGGPESPSNRLAGVMAWLESHQELGRHPKTRKLARLLDVSVPAAVGHLHFLWWWALDFAEDGDLSVYDAAEIAGGAMWEGEPDAFSSALHDAGFLEEFRIHDWWDYAGKLMERRRKDAERKRTSTGTPTEGAKSPSVTVPYRTEPKPLAASPSANGSSERKKRERDPLFEAVVEACGWELSNLTKDARGRANDAAKQLRELNVRPGLILGFRDHWLGHYPDANITPNTITKHWADYMAGNLASPGEAPTVSLREYPRSASGGEPGFAAVRSRYGDNMVQRMKNWPTLARNEALAQYCHEEQAEEDARKAQQALDRCRVDADYALAQAEKTARAGLTDWTLAPSAVQLRNAFFAPSSEEYQAKVRASREEWEGRA